MPDSDSVKFRACYGAPFFEKTPVLPWQVASFSPFQSCFLNAEMTFAEVGLFVVSFAAYGETDHNSISGMDKNDIVSLILQRGQSVVGGGIAVITDNPDDNFFPGCCCGLESWREWLNFLDGGHSPWLGHSPEPWMEHTKERTIKIWWDGAFEEPRTRGELCMEIDRAVYAANMARVERDLAGFAERLQAWARHEGVVAAAQLIDVVEKSFHLCADYHQMREA